jgi:hypothetical protein
MIQILMPDAGSYSAKLKALYIQHVMQMTKQPVQFFVVDDFDPGVAAEYSTMGLHVAKTLYGDAILMPCSSAARLQRYGYAPTTDPLVLSYFDDKRQLNQLAAGLQIPYMLAKYYKAIFDSFHGVVLKPAVSSGGKNIRFAKMEEAPPMADDDVIQAGSDDAREYISDVFVMGGGDVFLSCHRQSLVRVDGRDTEVYVFGNETPLGHELDLKIRQLLNSWTLHEIEDPLHFNVQWRYYRGELRVMEIDSRLSGSCIVHPNIGNLMGTVIPGWDCPIEVHEDALVQAYHRLNLGVQISDQLGALIYVG